MMLSHETYKKAFRQVQPSKELTMEELEMKKSVYVHGRIVTVVSAVAAAILLSGGVCYAANVGGIQDTVKLWMNGNQLDATIEGEEGEYTVTYITPDGTEKTIRGGGATEDENGEMRPVTAEEYLEYLNDDVYVDAAEDGRIYLCCQDQHIDLTDQFTICETKIIRNGEPLWVRVEKDADGGFGVQTSAEPWEFSEDYQPETETAVWEEDGSIEFEINLPDDPSVQE